MHEPRDASSMATVGGRPRGPSSNRQMQRPDARRSVVTGGALHGCGVADATQSATAQEQYGDYRKADVAGFRPAGGGDHGGESSPCPKERLETLGDTACDRRVPLRPQEESTSLEDARPQGTVSTANVVRLLEYQNYRCALTGRQLTPQTAALDHVVPIRFGGVHAIENAQVLHKDVNRAKGSLTSDEFIQLCREVAAHTVSNN